MNRVSYAYSYPRFELEQVFKIKRAKSLVEATRFIEYCFAPGHTSEPFVQLVEIRESRGKTSYTVVAEWIPRYRVWLSPLKAAGFESMNTGEGLRYEG